MLRLTDFIILIKVSLVINLSTCWNLTIFFWLLSTSSCSIAIKRNLRMFFTVLRILSWNVFTEYEYLRVYFLVTDRERIRLSIKSFRFCKACGLSDFLFVLCVFSNSMRK